MRMLFDCYHFWSGQSKFEDLDLVQPGDIGHVHFQDVPDMPRELLDQTTRVIPGDGVTPLVKILRKLAEKGYAGPLSVELFLPKFQQGDPYEVAQEIRTEGRSRHAPGARALIASMQVTCICAGSTTQGFVDRELYRAMGDPSGSARRPLRRRRPSRRRAAHRTASGVSASARCC